MWFRRFVLGCKARICQLHKPNLALPTELVVNLLNEVARYIQVSDHVEDKFDLVICGCFVAFSYVLSLTGMVGLTLNRSIINGELKITRSYGIISLKGQVKGETEESNHIFPCVSVTSSGIKIRSWLRLLNVVHARAITNLEGKMTKTVLIDDTLRGYLLTLFDEGDLFPPEIKSHEDVHEGFSIFRSLRRASDTRALEKKVAVFDIDIVNRWQTIEAAKGKWPAGAMRQHYSEVSLLRDLFLMYTREM